MVRSDWRGQAGDRDERTSLGQTGRASAGISRSAVVTCIVPTGQDAAALIVAMATIVEATDPRLNQRGYTLLSRDIGNICRSAHKHGVNRLAGRIMAGLWRRFVHGT